MSAILSTEDLNDFISPSVACIKPVETLPDRPRPDGYEVTTEGTDTQEARTAQISLTDCLACSGCVTSAEAVLVSMQSHAEVLNSLDAAPAIDIDQLGNKEIPEASQRDGKIFIASVSPQVRASLAATYSVTEKEAGAMIEQLLSGPNGLACGGRYGNKFTWVVDTNVFRDLALGMSIDELAAVDPSSSTKATCGTAMPTVAPVLSSACPGWICYAEKTHPYVLPHLSKVKSPQAMAGILFKSILAERFGIDPAQVWHLAVMPCFDKKLEASRQELTEASWRKRHTHGADIRDVDCVITAREIVMLAESRGVHFPSLSTQPLCPQSRSSFPDPVIHDFLFQRRHVTWENEPVAGTSGGYMYQILKAQRDIHPGSHIKLERGRNADVAEYQVIHNDRIVWKGARYYGFRNIQNLVRKLKPTRLGRPLPGAKAGHPRKPTGASGRELDYRYIEVMACPGGCTNGGGQIKVSDLSPIQTAHKDIVHPKDWLAKVDEAYFSTGRKDDLSIAPLDPQPPSAEETHRLSTDLIAYWSQLTGIATETLIYTTYREVDSDVGKNKPDTEKVAVLAGKLGGGW